MIEDEQLDHDFQAAWDAGRRSGLDEAAKLVEQIGGEFAFWISSINTAQAIRNLKRSSK